MKNKNFDEKLRKFKKIYIHPRNNNFKSMNKISNNIKQKSKLKSNLSQLLLDNNIITQKNNRSFLNCFNYKTTSNNYLKITNRKNIRYNFDFFNRYKNNCLMLNKNNNIFDKYEEILDELRNMKQNNKSININININKDFQIKNYNRKSKSINNKSSQKTLYDESNIKRNNISNKNTNNFNKIKDTFNDLKIGISDKKEYLNIKNNKKRKDLIIKYNYEYDKISITKKRSSKNIEVILSKMNEINNILKDRSRSTPKNNNILTTCENSNNNSNIKYKSNTEENNNSNCFIDIKKNLINNDILNLNFNKINYTLNNEYSVNHLKNVNDNKFKSQNKKDGIIIKGNCLDKNNNKTTNLNNSLFNEETDNQIQNWINKEKKSKEQRKSFEKNKNIIFFNDVINNNREFQNYKVSNKYFKNNEIAVSNNINNKPIKSMNYGNFFDLELNNFNYKLYNYNDFKNKKQNTINTGHIFKPIY